MRTVKLFSLATLPVWSVLFGFAVVRWALDPWVDNATSRAIRSIGGDEKGRSI